MEEVVLAEVVEVRGSSTVKENDYCGTRIRNLRIRCGI